MIRLAPAYDCIAGDILYHSLCLTNHPGYSNTADSSLHSSHATDIATVYSILKRELVSLIVSGHAALVSVCWERFVDLCEIHNAQVPHYFRVRRKFFLNKVCNIVPNISVIPKQDSNDFDAVIISSSLSRNDVRDLTEDEKVEIKLTPYNDNKIVHLVHVSLYI